jgi:hypothetical protein
MNARMFFLPSQQELCREIPALLRQHLYKEVVVEHLDVRDYDWNAARSYLNLLRASMVKEDDFRIGVEESNKRLWYLGYEDQDWYEDWHALKIPRESMTAIFPAVSVMDRMVMLPHLFQQAFDTSRDFSFFPKPLDLQGVLLVDFQDARAIREGVRQVGSQIKAEIAKLCRRYMFVNKYRTNQPDFSELARMLKIDRGFFEQHQDELFVPSVKLTPKIVSGMARLGKKSKVVLEIQNNSEDVLGKVRVQIRAPADILANPVAEYLDFSAGKAQIQQINFEVKPTARYCPLEVLIELDDPNQKYAPFPFPLILDVSEK